MQPSQFKLRVHRIDGAFAVLLPDDLVARPRANHMMTVDARPTPDGLELLAVDAEFARQIAVAEAVMERERDLLRRLAES